MKKHPVMLFHIVILLLTICCMACKNTPEEDAIKEKREAASELRFDKAKWNTKDGFDYPYRDKMLKDLRANDTLRRLKKEQVIDLLGAPDRIDSLYLFYTVARERIGFFTLHAKTLVIKLSDDSTPNKILIHE